MPLRLAQLADRALLAPVQIVPAAKVLGIPAQVQEVPSAEVQSAPAAKVKNAPSTQVQVVPVAKKPTREAPPVPKTIENATL